MFTSQVHAQWATWSTDEQRMFVASSIAITADWATTRDISQRYDEGYYEKNIALGPYPSKDRVDLYFIGLLVSNYYLADYSDKYRFYYLTLRTATHGYAAVNNVNIGLRIRF